MITRGSWSFVVLALCAAFHLGACKSKRKHIVEDAGPDSGADAGHGGEPGIELVSAGDLRTTEQGGQAKFRVVLTAQPTDDVTIPLTSSDPSEGSVAPSRLVFTAQNWNAPQQVTVTGVDDDALDGDVAYEVRLGAATSEDDGYDGLDGDDATVVNIDDETPGISVEAGSGGGLRTTEAGGQASFTVALQAQPQADVTIGVASGDASEVQASQLELVFTKDDWNAPKTVTLTGVNDDDIDGEQEVTVTLSFVAGDDAFEGVEPVEVKVINEDDDTAGVRLSMTAPQVSENGTQAVFSLSLVTRPTADVTITLVSQDEGEVVISPTSLTFTPDNWNALKDVIATGVDDDIADGDQEITISVEPAVSDDPDYDGLDGDDLVVTNLDNDSPGVLVAAADLLSVTEAGTQDTFTVVLRSRPAADVVVELSSSDPDEVLVSPATLTFTSVNWAAPQQVTVTGVDDERADGDQRVNIVTSDSQSDDPDYDGLVVDDVQVENIDLDSAGLLVDAEDLSTSESGDKGRFTVALRSRPTAAVTLAVASSDEGEVVLNPLQLSFTVDNWNAPQAIELEGVDDDVADGRQEVEITFSPTESDDPQYDGLTRASLTASNSDDDTAGITVSADDPVTTSEAGGQAEIGIVLNSRPAADVTLAISSSDPEEGTVSVASVTFTPANWNAEQSVLLTGVDDDLADGDQEYVIRIGPAESSDAQYEGITVPNVVAINQDDDEADIAVDAASNLTTGESGGQATFTVALTSLPTADVTIPVSSLDASEGSVSPTSLTFTPDNWNAPQTVTVTGLDEDVADGDQAYAIQIGPADSTDGSYDGKTVAPNLTVTNIDNDSAGVTVEPTTGLVTTEGGGQDTFTVVLNSQPTANVSFSLSLALSDDSASEVKISPSSLTFTSVNWNAPQTVTVTGVGDLEPDGNQSFTVVVGDGISDDPSYSGSPAADVTGTNLDNDSAAISVLAEALTTSEGGAQATFSIVLNSEPTANVSIALASSDTTEGTVAPGSLTFTPANWSAPQTVTITGVDDVIQDGDQSYRIHVGPAVSGDTAYGGRIVPDVRVTNTDNDSAGITLAGHTGLTTHEAGGQDTFSIVLNSQPTADVTLALSVSDDTEASVAPGSITFTPVNWNAPKLITLTGKDDALQDGDQPYQVLIGPAASADAAYDGRTVGNLSATNTDDDVAGIRLTAAPGLTTSEAGATASFTLVLNSQPTSDVSLPVSSSDPGEGTTNVDSLVFTSANWNVPQTVTVTGVDDDHQDGHQPYRIDLGPAESSDDNYDEKTVPSVDITNTDDDSSGITVTADPLVTQESGGQDSFTIVLDSQPTADVSIALASTDLSEAVVSPSVVTFTPSNWSAAQTVTVTGVDDSVADGPQPYQIELSVSSSDVSYAGITLPNVTGETLDDDAAGFELSKLSITTFEQAGTDTFTVKLTSQPTAGVSVDVSSLNPAEGTVQPSTLIFTSADWDTPQTVTVTGVDDGVLDGNQPYTVQLAAAVSQDPEYDGLNPSDVSAVNVEAALSCAELIALAPGVADGVYQLDTDRTGPNPQFEAYCDMTTDGGGWTLLAWNGDTASSPAGVPYPGLAYCADLSCARGSGVPSGSIDELFDNAEELAQGQSTTTNFKATFGNLGSYEYAGRFVYGSLADLQVEYSYTSCEGIAEGVYRDIVNTENDGVTVYLNRAFYHGGDASQSDFSSEDHGYVWSLGNRTGYCAVNNAMPASFLGTWSDGQYGPAVVLAVGSYSVWVR